MNIKILKSIFVLSLGFGVANAGEYFIGLEGGVNHAKIKEEGVSIISKNNTIISPKFGYAFTPEHRTYIAYEYANKTKRSHDYTIEFDGTPIGTATEKYEFASHRFLLGYEYAPLIAKDTRAVAGAFAGYSLGRLDVGNSIIGDVSPAIPSVLDGFSYGAKLGLSYEIGNWSIEFGGKIMHTIYKDRNINISFNHGGQRYTIKSEPLKIKQLDTGAYLGVNYKF